MKSKEAQELDQEQMEVEPALSNLTKLEDASKEQMAILMERLDAKAAEEIRQTWTREEMLEAGIPENLHPMVGWYDSLEEAKRELQKAGARL